MGVTSYAPLAVLAAVLALLVSGKVHRTTAALGGAVTVLGLGLITEEQAIEAVQWEALGLIFGMFILVAALSKSGFFQWIGLVAIRAVGYRPLPILVVLTGLTAVLSAFMDSITVMIFMASLTIEVARSMGFSPVPLLIAEITSANIGGAATMVGDPPNVIIGTSLGYGFSDFAVNTGPIAVAASAAMVPVIVDLAAATGVPLPSLAWTLALGADFGGNATPIGASGNVVGLAVAGKHGVRISWVEYMKRGVPSMLVSVGIANAMALVLFL